LPRVAVVGAGAHGLATGWALRRAGVEDVVVYEQFAQGHERGSSHGRTRIVRLAYADPAWVRFAQEAFVGWRALEEESGERILDLTGLLEIVGEVEDSSAPGLDAAGVPWERIEREEAERRWPVRLPEGTFAVLQPEAGTVRADLALEAFARGLDVRWETRVDSLDDLDADVVVVTAGAWVNDLVEPPLPVTITRETICYFRLDDPRPLPSLVTVKRGKYAHGFFALADPVHGLKVGLHKGGVEVEGDLEGEPDPAVVEQVAAWTRDRFQLADPEPVAAQTCLYTTLPEDEFVLERRGRVVVGSACSGHGFKFAPAVGERLARLALDGRGSPGH
jgi:sarcosine oxidase